VKCPQTRPEMIKAKIIIVVMTGDSQHIRATYGGMQDYLPGGFAAGCSTWPPNLKRIADKSLSPKLWSCRERKRSKREAARVVPPPSKYVPVVADFLKSVEEQFNFVPQRPQSEIEYKRAYAGAN
jgi:hypothetical protein